VHQVRLVKSTSGPYALDQKRQVMKDKRTKRLQTRSNVKREALRREGWRGSAPGGARFDPFSDQKSAGPKIDRKKA
jgi:hypothetical protein